MNAKTTSGIVKVPVGDLVPQQVVGNIQAPDGPLIVVRVSSEECDLPRSAKAANGELGRFEVDGTSYVVRRSKRIDEPPLGDLSRILTAREMEIAALVASGRGNKQIAAKLRISEHTVSSYLNRIYSKLRVHNRSSVAALYAAWASGLPRS